MASAEIDDLLSGPLVTWFASCLEDSNLLTSYDDLVDGILLHNVFLQIDPEPLHDEIIFPEGSSLIRTKNLKVVLDNMKQFYEEELGHLVLRLPDTMHLGKEPEHYVAEMKLLLLLLLGCAVQCPNKEKFITKIKTLNVDTQLAIVECIKQVTDRQDIVITQDGMENVNMGSLFMQIKKLTQELDLYRQRWRDTAINESVGRNDSSISVEAEEMNKVQLSNPVIKSEREDNHHYAVELADWKSRVRKQRQELEEKAEALLECKEELEYHKMLVTKLKQENQDLMHEARTAKSYRDELDAVIERADRADRLELEVVRYREKLTDIEFYKTRIEELREDNRVLMETREMLEDQLNSSRRRADKVLELESEIIKYKQLLNDMALERAADKEKYQELVEENTQLHKLTKATANEAALADSVQHTKVIELEKSYDTAVKEKQRVQSLLESVQRRADDLERSLDLANQKVGELKIVENNIKEINSKCLDLETKLVTVEKEKDTAQRDIYRYRETIEEKDVALDKAMNSIEVLERKVTQLEQELHDSVTQISRLQEIERSSKELDSRAAIDRETLEILQSNLVAEKLNTQQLYTVLEKLGLGDNMLLSLPLDNLLKKIAQIPEVVDYIKKSNDSCHWENPVSEYKNSENNETTNIHSTLEAMVESLKKEQEHLHLKLVTTQTASENLLSENAKHQVQITTLQSQNNSLAAQHTALQLANSQLVTEKEELLKERSAQQQTHTQLLHDQDTLQSLHEQLNNEYESLFHEHDALKSNLRDVKNEIRMLRESSEGLKGKNKVLQTEKESLVNNAKSLNNLRGEHSKLKDDFRNLYTATEKLKMEYRNLQEDYRKNKLETNRLSLKLTEMQGELSSKDERSSNLELQVNKLNQRCEMLLHVNSGLDNDRRSLMDHISLMFTQYHELLTRSLEDKEQYHMEEKMYTDKMNHLYRQKEKLEDKIMEHYRKLESCTPKKKGFGANLVRRVRKAGSELLSKNRRSWAEDSKHSEGKTYESESGGNDSDASTEDRLAGSASRSLGSDALSLGHPGTRRTVYYTDDSPPPPPPPANLPEQEDDKRSVLMEQTPRSEIQVEPRPVLIYNKVSAVINESKNINNSGMKDVGQAETIMETPIEKDPKAGSPVWYEYGCV
ncbi:protein girdin isoform X2 [Ptiloglossa arizonensis]|uniref:protein girdin isoform X2 n=1 Tax=Ptiloglossa arizonensis TaxID=3350558 RepID=UPI003FA057C6